MYNKSAFMFTYIDHRIIKPCLKFQFFMCAHTLGESFEICFRVNDPCISKAPSLLYFC